MSNDAQSAARATARKADNVAHKGSVLLTGQVPNTDVAMGHPLHPGTVHWPIAFLSASFGLSLLTKVPTSSYPSFLPIQASIPRLAHYAGVVGVLTAVPSIVTGLGEGYELVRSEYLKKGSWAKVLDGSWNMRDEGGKKVKMTSTHATMNDLVVGLAGANWWYVHKYGTYELPRLNVGLNAVALPLLLYSAYLGGKMVYEHAIGVQRQGEGREVKEKTQ